MTVTLITGASSGIGAATAHALLAAGHDVAVTGRSAERLAAFGSHDRLLTIEADAGESADVERAVAQTVVHFGGLTNVIANRGALPIKLGNDIIGAVGVSGAPGGDKDEACAKAGLDKVASDLK